MKPCPCCHKYASEAPCGRCVERLPPSLISAVCHDGGAAGYTLRTRCFQVIHFIDATYDGGDYVTLRQATSAVLPFAEPFEVDVRVTEIVWCSCWALVDDPRMVRARRQASELIQ